MSRLMVLEALIVFGVTMFFAATPLGSSMTDWIKVMLYGKRVE